MAGADLPQGETIRGRNIIPLLKGNAPDNWNNDLYGEYSTRHQSKTHMRMWRTPQWKLVIDFKNRERDELFNLQKDPAETRNMLAIKNAQAIRVYKELKAKIIAKMREVNDPILKQVKLD